MRAMRVLVVEDDEGISSGLRSQLRQQGCAVDVADTMARAWAALAVEPFDLVLLDLGLPDGDGSALVSRLRAQPSGAVPDAATPVLVMTARDEVPSRIAALDLGADDYVVKPFDVGELTARMRALRRRSVGRARPRVVLGDVELDPAARQAWRGGLAVELSAREFAVLLALAEVRPRVLSRLQIEERLYDWGAAGVESNAIEVHVHRLRRKLGDDIIRTLRGVGYFVAAT
jgi:two-component system OmpR family response regulator/two-component system response regulator QseB